MAVARLMQKPVGKVSFPRTVLIPILSKRENKPDFLVQSTAGFERVVLLSVIDRDESVGSFGFAANEIRVANHLMEEISAFLSAQGKGVESVLEWGGVIAKIAQSAGFYRCDKIVLVVQENEYYHHLVEGLRSQTQIEVEEVVVPSDEKNTNKP